MSLTQFGSMARSKTPAKQLPTEITISTVCSKRPLCRHCATQWSLKLDQIGFRQAGMIFLGFVMITRDRAMQLGLRLTRFPYTTIWGLIGQFGSFMD
jgi:hypothetical protein